MILYEWKPKQLECRVVITHVPVLQFQLGMFGPQSMRYEPLGTHPRRDIDRIVRDLKVRIEKENHIVTFSEMRGPR